MLSPAQISLFRKKIWLFYRASGRCFSWRHVDDPYRVMVSEVMLQQTQTHRVAPKYELFLLEFPTLALLADTNLRDLLSVWQGLGYNRRARYLRDAARLLMDDHGGVIPNSTDELQKMPGIGHATASAICAYAFNEPVVFIETNIRAVFIHTFFPGAERVHDRELVSLIEQTVDRNNPRDWYYALTDYGVMLKAQHANPSRRSRHHVKQSKFEGSDRQIRGAILRLLSRDGVLSLDLLLDRLGGSQERFARIIDGLVSDELVVWQDNRLQIA